MASAPEHRLESLFAEALDRSPDERRRFLKEVCREQPELERELRELLAAHEECGDFFDDLSREIRAGAETELETAVLPRVQIGAYQTIEVLGHGGMGAVYRARRVDGAFEQEVALKLPHLDMQTPQLRARFVAERQLLAQLSHAHIARLLDGGITDEGRPYFVMELVEGEPLTRYSERMRLSLEDRLRLFLEMIDAVSYLHRNLIVHRDLKPSNIFVDREGQVKLLDFGVAKMLEDEASLPATMTAERLLTPQYAAPEQLSGGRVSTGTDIYALGVVLYELLTGRLPHDRTRTSPIRNDLEPTVAPSAAVKSASKMGESCSVAWRKIAGDLDNICLKALRPEPERRFVSAEQMGLDVERFLDGMPVSARPSTLGYRAARFVQRHRVGVAIAAGVVVLLASAGIRERTLRGQAQRQAQRAETVSSLLAGLISSADPANAQGREVTVLEVLDAAETGLAAEPGLAATPTVEAEVRVVLGRTYGSLGRLSDARTQFERAIELGAGVDGAEEITLRAQEELALQLKETEPERAKAMLRQVVAAREWAHGPADDLTLSAKASLSRILRNPEDYAEAEALDREILEQRRAVLSPVHPETLKAMNSLAGTYFSTSRYEYAAELYETALEAARVELGPDHPETLRYGGNLAATYAVLGRYADSEARQREVLEARLRILGPKHRLTGMSLHNLGHLLLRQAKFEAAESVFRQAMAARLEGGQTGYLYSQSFLADTLREMGREREAEALYLETMAAQQELFGPGFPDTYRTMLGLGELHLRRADFDSAVRVVSEALVGYTKIHGQEHPQVGSCLLLLARIERSRGRPIDAEVEIDRAIEILGAQLADDHPALIDARLERAAIRLATGEAGPALEGLAELVEIRLGRLGAEHPRSREAVELLVAARAAAGRPDGS